MSLPQVSRNRVPCAACHIAWVTAERNFVAPESRRAQFACFSSLFFAIYFSYGLVCLWQSLLSFCGSFSPLATPVATYLGNTIPVRSGHVHTFDFRIPGAWDLTTTAERAPVSRFRTNSSLCFTLLTFFSQPSHIPSHTYFPFLSLVSHLLPPSSRSTPYTTASSKLYFDTAPSRFIILRHNEIANLDACWLSIASTANTCWSPRAFDTSTPPRGC